MRISRGGLLPEALGGSGWLLAVPLTWNTQASPFAVLGAGLMSITVILIARVRRLWPAARQESGGDYVDHRYRAHRAALADPARDYREGRLDGDPTLPPGVRSLCPSGFAYADRTALLLRMWQNRRAGSEPAWRNSPRHRPPGRESPPRTATSAIRGARWRRMVAGGVGRAWWYILDQVGWRPRG